MISKPNSQNDNLLFVLFCGIISVSGMTLPGLSGSFLLLLLGNYTLLLVDAVNAIYYTLIDLSQFNFYFWKMILVLNYLLWPWFYLRIFIRFNYFFKCIKFCFKKFKQLTLSTIIGFISGSLGVIWPWRKIFLLGTVREVKYNGLGNPIIESYDYYLPDFFNTNFGSLLYL